MGENYPSASSESRDDPFLCIYEINTPEIHCTHLLLDHMLREFYKDPFPDDNGLR